MKLQGLSVKRLFFYVTIGLILSMTAAAVVLYFITEQAAVLAVGGVLILCALAIIGITDDQLSSLRQNKDVQWIGEYAAIGLS